MSVETRQLTYNSNQTIEYDFAGNGAYVFLIHGFGEDKNVWHHQVQALKNNFTVIAPNLPGIGASSFIQTAKPKLGLYAAAIHKIVEAEQITKAAFIGHSMGGYTALAYLKKYKNFVQSLGLVNSSIAADSTEKKEQREKGIEMLQTYGSQAFLEKLIPTWFYDKQRNANTIKKLIAESAGFSTHCLVQFYQAMMARSSSETLLQKIKIPYLFIAGEHDPLIPIQQTLTEVQEAKLAQLTICFETAHMAHLEEVEKTVLSLQQFLSLSFDRS